jgi:hypothetical protein
MHAYYSTANQATPPTAWTLLLSRTDTLTVITPTVDVGIVMATNNTSNNFTGSVLAFDDSRMSLPYAAASDLVAIDPTWGAQLYDTSATAQQVFLLDLGYDDAPAIPQAWIRSWVASREGLVETRSTSTATWDLAQSNTNPPTAGDYTTSALITSVATGRWACLRVKAVSGNSGADPWHFLLD